MILIDGLVSYTFLFIKILKVSAIEEPTNGYKIDFLPSSALVENEKERNRENKIVLFHVKLIFWSLYHKFISALESKFQVRAHW